MKTVLQSVDETRKQYLSKARRYASRKYRQLREENERYHHASFDVRDALLAAEKRFTDLGTFGVESITEINGHNTNGVELCYLNTGETYDLTICYDWNRQQFILACWGDIVEGTSK